MSGVPNGPLFRWQAAKPDELDEHIAARITELRASTQPYDYVAAELQALESKFSWGRGIGIANTVLSGFAAASYVGYSMNEQVLLIDRRDEFSNIVGKWRDEQRVGSSGRVPNVTTVASTDIASKVIEVASAGETATIFSPGEQVDELLPGLIQLSDAQVNCTVFVSTNASSAMTEIVALTKSDCPLLWAASPQECHDMAIIATALSAVVRVPVIVCFDATHSGHSVADVGVGTPAWLQRFVDTAAYGGTMEGSTTSSSVSDNYKRLSRSSFMGSSAPSALQPSALTDTSASSDCADATATTVMSKLLTSMNYNPMDYTGSATATTVLVVVGPGSVTIPAMIKARNDPTLGVLSIRAFRPWCTTEFLNRLVRSTKDLVILDNSEGKGLFESVSVAVLEDAQSPTLYHAIFPSNIEGVSTALALSLLSQCTSLPALGAPIVVDAASAPDTKLTKTSSSYQAVFWSIESPRSVLKDAQRLTIAISTEPLRESRARMVVTKDSTPGSTCSRAELALSTEAHTPMMLESVLTHVDYVACGHSSLLLMPNYDLLPAAYGATLVVNCSWGDADADQYIPASLKHKIALLGIRLFLIDADALCHRFSDTTPDQLLQALFWPLCTRLDLPGAISDKFDGKLEPLAAELQPFHYPTSWVNEHVTPSTRLRRFVPLQKPQVVLDNKPIAAYSTLLAELFGEDSIVADSRTSDSLFGTRYVPTDTKDVNAVFSSTDNDSEISLGAHLVKSKLRTQLIQNVATFVATQPTAAEANVHAVLARWHAASDDRAQSQSIGETARALLNSLPEKSRLLESIAQNSQFFSKPSKWILGGDSWAFDISYSGIHHIMASGEDVNILVLDTTPQSQVLKIARETGRTRKDIGLYAMNYGSTYVASTAASHSRTQAVKALLEADAFKGPSVVLAYAPLLSEDSTLSAAADVASAVDSGKWPLYRWDPNNTDPFKLDSAKLRKDVEAFVKRDTDLSIMYTSNTNGVGSNAETKTSLEDSILEQHMSTLSTASGVESSNVEKIDLSIIVAFGSDNGNGMAVAERFAKKAEVRHVREVKCVEANSLTVDELKESDVVVFIMSTAGQGEMCGNAKTFWAAVNKTKAIPSSVRYGVFGLGDSAYWGKGTDDSARYYCKPATDLENVLKKAGASPILDVGYGDDQHENGYEGGFAPWMDELFDTLGVKAVAGENNGILPEMIDDDIKTESNYLRGHILQSLADTSTGKILPEDAKLTKFHGIYQQDDRDIRAGLEDAGKERAYSFMIRVGIPGGVNTPNQLLRMLKLADSHCSGVLKLTTRQAYQVHGVIKGQLKPTMQIINRGLMDTLAACGDVCRNVIATPNPMQPEIHEQVLDFARRIQTHLKPQTAAYHEIWMDKKMVSGHANEECEPLYGPTYLPRKFKIAIAIPPLNDVDVFSHCLGFIAIVVNGKLLGFNVAAGGGMGMTHGNTATYPRLSDVMGFCTVEQAIDVGEKIMLVQRDFGDRKNRQHARLKYTMEDHGVDWYRAEVEKRCGYKLGAARPFKFTSNGDRMGWTQGTNGYFHYGVFVENGRVVDEDGIQMRTGLEAIAKVHEGDFRLTANQHIIIGNVHASKLTEISSMLQKYNIDNGKFSEMRLNSMACVALPTCALAMAESQRYLPSLITKMDVMLAKHGLTKTPITIRMTGCPNGCARPYMAEIAFVGKAPGAYNMYLGGGFSGERLNKLWKESVTESQILGLIDPLFEDYSKNRIGEERFGDFCIRREYIAPSLAGNHFHEQDKSKCSSVATPSGTNHIYW